MSKTTKIIFIISVLVNVLFIGSIVGGAIKHCNHRREFKFTKQFSNFDKEQKAKVNEERAKLFEILKADNFNKQEFDAQLDKVSKLQENMYVKFMNDMATNLSAMPKEERLKTIEDINNRFDKPFYKKPGHKRRFDKRHEPEGKHRPDRP